MRDILVDIKQAGLGSMPGGGAEIFHPEVRDQICEHKADAQNWLDIHRTAHELGLRTNCTMLYGHIENSFHRVDHLIRLRELQDQTGGFQTFIPLAFHPDNTGLEPHSQALERDGPAHDGRQPADARQCRSHQGLLDHAGRRHGEAALAYGADDLDGTVRHELIYHDAGAETPEILTVDDIRRLIVEAGREPVERDTLYHRIERDGTALEISRANRRRAVTRMGTVRFAAVLAVAFQPCELPKPVTARSTAVRPALHPMICRRGAYQSASYSRRPIA